MRHELFEPVWTEHGFGTRLQDFQKLMRHRVRDVLLVSSLFDLYLFEEDGRLYEQIQTEYAGMQLSHTPELTRVSSGSVALDMLEEGVHFDLLITTLHIEDISALRLAREIKERGLDIPIVLLAYDTRELNDLLTHQDTSVFDRMFVWQGDFRLLIAAIKDVEDRKNVDADTSLFGVQCIVLVEDSIRHYSSFLPLLYSEVINHSRKLISEGLNSAHRSLRMRARPKILLCESYEEAWEVFEKYQQYILGVISDVGFPRKGSLDVRAGLEFGRSVKEEFFDVPLILQSTNARYKREAYAIGASFLEKSSPTLVDDFRRLLRDYFGFGDFVFRTPDGREAGRANDLTSLEQQLRLIPDESLLYHGARNHFSTWLKARTEFRLAYRLRPRKISDYESVADLRGDLIQLIDEHRSIRQRGLLTEFSRDTFDPESSFARIGGGSLGGKARGLSFINALLSSYMVRTRFEDTEIIVPASVVVCTDVFDRFLEENGLRDFAIHCGDDEEILRRFVATERFPDDVAVQLRDFLDLCREPIAVRSSSLLEDSQYHPFAGVYQTYMIPNSHHDANVRLAELLMTIKRVYASTFFQSAKDYTKATAMRTDDEKMAVIIQKIVGARHGARFYPVISGVGRSYNFYPVEPQKPEDGIASVALGLGRTIVEGGQVVRFCPRYPDHVPQLHSPAAALKAKQRHFYALDMTQSPLDMPTVDDSLVRPSEIAVAEEDGTLGYVASTYSLENDALYDGISRKGVRVVTFAPILRSKVFPLAEVLSFLSDLGAWGMGTPVELEFAARLSPRPDGRRVFAVLQMRPMVLSRETDEMAIGDELRESLVCQSTQILGHGVERGIHDILVVDVERFERSNSREVAREVARMNAELVSEGRGYVLIGPGRWGTTDSWLGIPVRWEQISGARAIVEAELRDMSVDPSQGSHFFQNLTAFQVGYFSVTARAPESFVDWPWLESVTPLRRSRFVRHLRFEDPVIVRMNGHQRRGIILKPSK
jgi:CheY-like chemotaxis protein